MTRFLVCFALALTASACSEPLPPTFDSSQALHGKDALKCVSMAKEFDEGCYGASVVLTGFPISDTATGYRFSTEHRDSFRDDGEADDFVATFQQTTETMKGKVAVAGYVTNGGLHPLVTIVHWEPAKMTALEAQLVSTEKAKRALEAKQQDDDQTAEQMIAAARKEGARALEEWDAAIRKNNADVKAALAARAVAHQVRLSHNLRVDMYGMPDGRWIACKTEIYPRGAPITTCDGEPQ